MHAPNLQITCCVSLALAALCFACRTSSPSFEVRPAGARLGVHCKFGFKNELNTFAGTFQKDLVEAGTITVPFSLSSAEQDTIIREAIAVEFCSFPDTIPKEPGTIAVQPYPGVGMLRLQYEGCDKVVVWEDPTDSSSVFARRLEHLTGLIWRVVEGKEEYKSLPPAVGGYE
jgi:hypothetical protein